MATINPNYSRTSLYAKTGVVGNYLDVARFPQVPKLADDVIMTINKTYQFRPDLLAYDLYGDSNFWWAFALRNPNTIKDPVFDMKPGVRIYIPKKTTLTGII
jgi:hypothetical protein